MQNFLLHFYKELFFLFKTVRPLYIRSLNESNTDIANNKISYLALGKTRQISFKKLMEFTWECNASSPSICRFLGNRGP
jgi:hypothetical protein